MNFEAQEARLFALRNHISTLLDKEIEVEIALSKAIKQKSTLTLSLAIVKQSVLTLKHHAPVVVLDTYSEAKKNMKRIEKEIQGIDAAIKKLELALSAVTDKIEDLEEEFYLIKDALDKNRKIIHVDFKKNKRDTRNETN